MAYFIDLFSPETYEAFKKSSQQISGFRQRQQGLAKKVRAGDKFVCYVTKLSRWFGVLEVLNGPYLDDTPIFYPDYDPFIVRFDVKPIVCLQIDKAIPIHEDFVWNELSFTQGQEKTSPAWTGKIRNSLNPLTNAEGIFLEKILLAQRNNGKTYPLDYQEYEKLLSRPVRGPKKMVMVSVPQRHVTDLSSKEAEHIRPRESLQIQALIAEIGAKMDFKIWLPNNDRANVMKQCKIEKDFFLDKLPLNYDDATLKTIEQIDVLWLKRRSIVRAFEVEHTTSIYSGILRMADLLALQPNMDISLHIVAPEDRRDKVFQELRRPVFSLLEGGPLYEKCTYLSYENLRTISTLKHLERMTDAVLQDYAEEVE